MKEYVFKDAIPVWEEGKECEKNYHLIFECSIPAYANAYLAIATSNNYQLFINHEFVAQGPARAGHGYFRVDQIKIGKYLEKENNEIRIYAASYYVKNFYLPRQTGFLCAEIVSGKSVVCATGHDGFVAYVNTVRMQKVNRYSFQRTFTEVYDFKSEQKQMPVRLVSANGTRFFIERGVPYPNYEKIDAQSVIIQGKISDNRRSQQLRDRYIDFDDPERGFLLSELDVISCDEIAKLTYMPFDEEISTPQNVVISADCYATYSLPCEKTGFLQLEVECTEDTQLMVAFDEILTDGDVTDFTRLRAINAVIWYLKKGSYVLTTYEPYSMKYLKVINKSEKALLNVKEIKLIELALPYKSEGLGSDNKKLNLIYEAAVENFRQNTLDIYMDCPSRERAGWLCDSFFTARVEYALTGKSEVEKNFLENFIYKERFYDIPEGMIPMCYPADFCDKEFIPQWAMWYVIELDEYAKRSGDFELIKAAEQLIKDLIIFLEKYENEDGLLENLPGWNFVEWSKANEFTSGVNYPTNMLYGKMLQAAGNLYDQKYSKKTKKIFEKVREQSFYEGFFRDHSVRQENNQLKLIVEDVSETCQYYAFFCGAASPEKDFKLWSRMVNEFGADRLEKGLWKEVYPSNAFIGYYLRLELLAAQNLKNIVLNDIELFFAHMAEETGTLWENKTSHASCNHGFASYVAVILQRCI